MEKNWLETGLNDKLGDYASSMDLEEAWNAIDAKRHPNKKKRRFIGWWLLGLLALIVGFFLWHKSKVSDSTPGVVASNVIEKEQTDNTPNDQILAVQKDITTGLVSKEKSNSTVTIEQIYNNKNTLRTLGSTMSENSELKRHNFLNKKENFQNSSINKNDFFKTNPQDYSERSNTTLNESQIRIEEEVVTFSNVPLLSSSKIKYLDFSIFDDILPIQFIRIKSRKAIEFPSNYIGIASGYSFASTGKSSIEESTLDAFSLNLFYQKYLKKNVYLKTGFSFNQFTNELASTHNATRQEQANDQVIAINLFQNGNVENELGPGITEIIEKTTFQIFNKYKFVNIPILIGVTLNPKSRINFQIEGGISTSIFSKFDGKILTNNGSEIFNDLNRIDLKKAGIVNGRYGLGCNFTLTKNNNWNAFVNYQGNLQFNKLSNTSSLNVEKFNSQQLFIGLKYGLKYGLK